jgi:hypothetical protein
MSFSTRQPTDALWPTVGRRTIPAEAHRIVARIETAAPALANQDRANVTAARLERATSATVIARQRPLCPWRARARHPFKVEPAAGNEMAQSPGRRGAQRPFGFAPRPASRFWRIESNEAEGSTACPDRVAVHNLDRAQLNRTGERCRWRHRKRDEDRKAADERRHHGSIVVRSHDHDHDEVLARAVNPRR